MKIKIINKSQNVLPSYATDGSAGLDLSADIFESVAIGPNERRVIPTGVFIELPKEYEAQIRSRSGLTLKKGLVVANSPGTIDSDYRGEIGIIIHNISESNQFISPGDRIAQMIITKHERIEWDEVDSLTTTERDEGGFGSTGK